MTAAAAGSATSSPNPSSLNQGAASPAQSPKYKKPKITIDVSTIILEAADTPPKRLKHYRAKAATPQEGRAAAAVKEKSPVDLNVGFTALAILQETK